MTRDVHDEDRVVGRGGVEILAGRMAPLGEKRVVVAKTEYPSARIGLGGFRFERDREIADRSGVSDRRAVDIDADHAEARARKVTVSVDEARQECSALEVVYPCASLYMVFYIGAASYRDDPITFDRHGLRDRLRRVHRQNDAAQEDLARRRLCWGDEPIAASGEDENDRGDDQESAFHEFSKLKFQSRTEWLERGSTIDWNGRVRRV